MSLIRRETGEVHLVVIVSSLVLPHTHTEADRYTHTHTLSVCVYIYIERERERERGRGGDQFCTNRALWCVHCCSVVTKLYLQACILEYDGDVQIHVYLAAISEVRRYRTTRNTRDCDADKCHYKIICCSSLNPSSRKYIIIILCGVHVRTLCRDLLLFVDIMLHLNVISTPPPLPHTHTQTRARTHSLSRKHTQNTRTYNSCECNICFLSRLAPPPPPPPPRTELERCFMLLLLRALLVHQVNGSSHCRALQRLAQASFNTNSLNVLELSSVSYCLSLSVFLETFVDLFKIIAFFAFSISMEM